MPRIAYLYSRYPVVSQTFCDSEMLALEAMGFDLEIVSLNAPPDSFRHERLDRLRAGMHYPPPEAVLDAEATDPTFEEKLGPLIKDHETRYGKSYKPQVRARNAWHFAPLLRRLGISHVHVHFANRATHTALFLKELGFTFSFTAHAQDFMVDLGNDDLLREMVHKSEFVVAVSDFSRNLLVQTCPADDARIIRIYNGIELDDFTPAKPDTEAAPICLVGVGRLIEFKGFQNLISAVDLLKQRGLAVEARIIGEGPHRLELEAQITAAGLEQNIHLLGVRSQEQIKAELMSAQAFVLPSIIDRKGASDILPTVITEALACRLPVISTTVAGIPEMVAHGRNGLLVEPGDIPALADAIQQLASQPALRKSFGDAGRIYAEQNFALSLTAAQLATHFEKATSAQTSAVRLEQPVVYYTTAWNAETTQDLPQDARMRLLTVALDLKANPATPDQLSTVDLLPDASVLESLWLRRPAWRQQLEKLRSIFGEAISGEDFYQQARRAIWMAEALPRRGARHLHAFRADAAVTVWLWHQLTKLPVSATIEDSPALSRAMLAKLLPAFVLASVSDEKLAAQVGIGVKDVLKLKNPPSHQELRLGPLRVKRRTTAVVQDRKALEKEWFDCILHSLHA